MNNPEDFLDYWQIDLVDNGFFRVDQIQAASVRHQLEEGIVEWAHFKDLSNSEIFYRLSHIVGVFNSTINGRSWERQWAKLRKAEDPIE